MRTFLTLILLSFALISFGQSKMIIRTCQLQYGDIINYDLDDVIMESDPIPFVTKFALTKDHFIEITDDGKYKYSYASENSLTLNIKEDFRITIKDELLNDYEVFYSYINQTLTFVYSDGNENLRLTRFTIDNIKLK